MPSRITRDDVARRAGVSPTVVSYVLNESNYVSSEKREAVLKAVRDLNYKPDLFARSLRTKKSHQIALIGDTLQEELFGTLSALLSARGYYPCLFFSHHSQEFVNRLLGNRYDAIFMASNGFEAETLNIIAEQCAPIILYQSREYEKLSDRIVVRAPDFYQDVKRIINFLIMKGHHRIGFIPPLKYRAEGMYGKNFRAEGYMDGLRENGIKSNPDFFCEDTGSMDLVFDFLLKLMTDYPVYRRPTAFIVSDDHVAAQVMQYLKNIGLCCPRDVAIVGWGNIASSRITTPALTTMDSNIQNFTIELADALIELSEGNQPESKVYPGKIILRNSV